MRLRDILVQLDSTEAGRHRMQLAADRARRHRAHLTGLHAFDVVFPLVLADPGSGAMLAGQMLDSMRQDAIAAAAGIEAGFREQLRRDGIAGEWRLVEGAIPEQVSLPARYAGLLVLGQESPDAAQATAGGTIEAALFSSGRPVLVVPHAGRFESIGRRVLIGWNASREAARAVHDALPLIARAEAATVLAVNPRSGIAGHGEEPGADIARHLARHELKVTVERTEALEIGAGDAILNRAAELLADLLVIGAYGHSRVRELVLGGVTRTLLRQMTVPALLSH